VLSRTLASKMNAVLYHSNGMGGSKTPSLYLTCQLTHVDLQMAVKQLSVTFLQLLSFCSELARGQPFGERFFLGQMPFLSAGDLFHSTEGKSSRKNCPLAFSFLILQGRETDPFLLPLRNSNAAVV